MSPSSGGQMSKIMMSTGMVSQEASLLGLEVASFPLCPHWSPSVRMPDVRVFKFPLLRRTPDEIRAQPTSPHF